MIGVQYNNPAVLVELEREIWPDTVDINCLLSIGTGLSEAIKIVHPVLENTFKNLQAMKKLITHTERAHLELKERHKGKNRYFRLNVDDGIVGEVDLTAFQQMPFIKEQTKKYLRRENVRKKILSVATRLRGTSGCSPAHDPDYDAESIAKINAETASRCPELESESEEEEMQSAIRLLGLSAAIVLDQSGSDWSESDSRASSSRAFVPGMSSTRSNTRSGMSGSYFNNQPIYRED